MALQLRKAGQPLGGLEFELCEGSAAPAPAVGPTVSQRRRRQRGGAAKSAPFASVSMQGASSGAAPAAKHVPAFMVASAVESAPRDLTGVPQWRITAGDLAAGATSGCAVEAALYPIDTIKTRLQAMRSGGGIRALLQSGGGRSLYAGVWGNLAGVAPASAIFMAVYEPTKQYVMKRVGEQQQFLGPLAGGVAAGLASSLVRVPTEVVKTRMQTGEFTRAWAALTHIVAKEGRRGIFAGYGSFLLRDLPFDAIEFGMYEVSKSSYKAVVKRELNPAEHSMLGAVAGAVTGFVTTPLDVLKTRMMLAGASGQYKSVADCATQILRNEGAGALLRGWQPRVMWIGIGGSVFFTVLEASKKFYAPKPQPKPCCAGKDANSKKKAAAAAK